MWRGAFKASLRGRRNQRVRPSANVPERGRTTLFILHAPGDGRWASTLQLRRTLLLLLFITWFVWTDVCISLGDVPGSRIAGAQGALCVPIGGTARLFSAVAAPFDIPPVVHEGSGVSMSSPALVTVCL